MESASTGNAAVPSVLLPSSALCRAARDCPLPVVVAIIVSALGVAVTTPAVEAGTTSSTCDGAVADRAKAHGGRRTAVVLLLAS